MNLDLALTIFRQIVDQGSLTTEQYFRACGSTEIGNPFLLRNDFATDSQGLYNLENKITGNAVRARLAKPTLDS